MRKKVIVIIQVLASVEPGTKLV